MRVYTFFLILLFSVGCKNSKVNYNRVLDKVEQCMAQTPDSALMLLNTINMGDIDSKSTKARYALLKAIALDKNYIDATDDSLTSIAVKYYSGKRASEDKMKAYFYNGRIHFNSKNYEKAMESYLIAEESVSKCKDLTYVGLLYNSKALLYSRIYDYVKAFEQFELAASYYLKNKDTSRYLGAVNNIIVNFSTRGVVEGADKYISVLEDNWEKLTVIQKSNYYSNRLTSCIERKGAGDEMESITSSGMYDVPAVGGEYITFAFNLGLFESSKIPVFYNSASFIDDLNMSIANSGDLNFTVESIEQSEYDDMAGYMTIYVGPNISPGGYEYVVSIIGALGGRITLNQASY